jgi:flavodoxin
MKPLPIAYAASYGSTREVAERVGEVLAGRGSRNGADRRHGEGVHRRARSPGSFAARARVAET